MTESLRVTFQQNLQQWTAKEPERLLIELKDLRNAKETAETKLQKIERRMERVRRDSGRSEP